MADQVKKIYGNPDAIAGVATGAIGIGMLVADRLGLRYLLSRPETKSVADKIKLKETLSLENLLL